MNPTVEEERSKAISIYHLILRHERGFGAGSGEIARIQFKNRSNAISPIIVGSFDRRALVGRPANWRFVPPLRNRAQLELAGKYLLAVTLPLCRKVSDMVCFRPQQIGAVQANGTGAALEIEMRAPTIFDPPITLAIPRLLCREAPEASRSGRTICPDRR